MGCAAYKTGKEKLLVQQAGEAFSIGGSIFKGVFISGVGAAF